MSEHEVVRLATPDEAAEWWPHDKPETYVVAVTAAKNWRLWKPSTRRKCRGSNPRRCPNEPVAECARAHGRGGMRWWSYCSEHMYGKWVENGRVLGFRLMRESDLPAELRQAPPRGRERSDKG